MKELVPHLWVRQHLWLPDHNLQKQTTLLERKRGTTPQLLYIASSGSDQSVQGIHSGACSVQRAMPPPPRTCPAIALLSHPGGNEVSKDKSIEGTKSLWTKPWLTGPAPHWPMLSSHADTPKRDPSLGEWAYSPQAAHGAEPPPTY